MIESAGVVVKRSCRRPSGRVELKVPRSRALALASRGIDVAVGAIGDRTRI